MKFLVASDIHLSEWIWRHRPIFGDSLHGWNQVVALAIANQVDGVILAGDVLDQQKNCSITIRWLNEGLQRLSQAKIPVYYNQGQHEYQTSPWISGDNTLWLHENTYPLNADWTMSGCDFQHEDAFQEFLKGPVAAESNILVCHQVWKNFMGDVGKPQATFDDVPEHVKILITGDFHEHLCVQHNGMFVLSPGSTHMRSIAEPENHFVFLLDLSNTVPKISSLPLTSRRFIPVSTEGLTITQLYNQINSSIDTACAYGKEHLPVDLQTPLLRLTHGVKEVSLVDTLKAELVDKVHFFSKPKFKSAESVTPDASVQERISLITGLDRFIDKSTSPRAHELASALISCAGGLDISETLENWIKQQLGE
jgi:DNA repair exonuclease SbcCD nuclease subunit